MSSDKQVKPITSDSYINHLVCTHCLQVVPVAEIKTTSRGSYPICTGCHNAGINDCYRCGSLEPHPDGNCLTCAYFASDASPMRDHDMPALFGLQGVG